MRIEMRAQLSGTRDGAEWPAPGQVIDLPEDEALLLVAGGLAVPLADAPAVSTVGESDPGTGSEPSRRGRRKADS
jgi:hypothetical protein